MFDLGRLFHEVKNIDTVKVSFDKTVEKEIAYRGRKCNREDVLDDIIQTGLLIAKREKNKMEPHLSNFREIQKGLLQFKPYQMSSFFRIDEAVVSSAKAALMAAKIKSGASGALDIFQPDYKKQDFLIHNPEFNFLNKLHPEALFYWQRTMQILSL